MPQLTVITPTGGRPEAFALCERYLSRQSYSGDWEWIVVDDCEPKTRCTMGQRVLRPKPLWRAGGGTTQHRNLLVALEQVNSDCIIVVEDDDWYGPHHLDNLCNQLEKTTIAGEQPGRYYNVQHRLFMEMRSTRSHASLCQTGFQSELVPVVQGVCRLNGMIDVSLWQKIHELRLSSAFYLGGQVVGVKGMPGRFGAGIGHSPQGREGWAYDLHLHLLRQWVGDDAELYSGFWRECIR